MVPVNQTDTQLPGTPKGRVSLTSKCRKEELVCEKNTLTWTKQLVCLSTPKRQWTLRKTTKQKHEFLTGLRPIPQKENSALCFQTRGAHSFPKPLDRSPIVRNSLLNFFKVEVAPPTGSSMTVSWIGPAAAVELFKFN